MSARAFRQYAEGDGRVKSRWRSSLSTCSETPQQHACSETPQAPPTPQPPPSMTLRESRPWRPCTKWMKRRRQRMLLLLRLQVFLALNLRSVPLLVFCLCFCLCLCRLRAFRLSRKMDIFGLLRAANQKQKLMKHMLAHETHACQVQCRRRRREGTQARRASRRWIRPASTPTTLCWTLACDTARRPRNSAVYRTCSTFNPSRCASTNTQTLLTTLNSNAPAPFQLGPLGHGGPPPTATAYQLTTFRRPQPTRCSVPAPRTYRT